MFIRNVAINNVFTLLCNLIPSGNMAILKKTFSMCDKELCFLRTLIKFIIQAVRP